ncbi:MAG: hypothetical protein HQ559_15435 [Lentisphaerae bacterium]|nr:hypothetical protein [Lentisphaerota bacterium]
MTMSAKEIVDKISNHLHVTSPDGVQFHVPISYEPDGRMTDSSRKLVEDLRGSPLDLTGLNTMRDLAKRQHSGKPTP